MEVSREEILHIANLAQLNLEESEIDNTAGIVLEKKMGDVVSVGEIIAYVHANDEQKGKEAVEKIKSAYKISEMKVEKEKIILGVI